MRALSDEAVAAEAKLQMQASLAIRDYTQNFVRPYLDAHPSGGFAEISVPAFASRQTLDLLYRHYPGYRYREAALNPTNPKDLASGWEIALIERFRATAPEDDRVEIVHSADGNALNAAKPIRINNQA
ncbi:MAG: Tll0287-like domain-containing protein, partial [Rhodoferax sp.]